jgi:hypothetical protein
MRRFSKAVPILKSCTCCISLYLNGKESSNIPFTEYRCAHSNAQLVVYSSAMRLAIISGCLRKVRHRTAYKSGLTAAGILTKWANNPRCNSHTRNVDIYEFLV